MTCYIDRRTVLVFPHGSWSYLKSLISTTSLISSPRAQASRFPSEDQSKLKICPVVKLVNCFGCPPSSGWAQMLETLLRLPTYVTAAPSGAQRMMAGGRSTGGVSKTFRGAPPSIGRMAILSGVFGTSL